jgi:hypothetical protein
VRARLSPVLMAVVLLWPAAPVRAAFITDPTGDTFNSGTIDIVGTEVILSPTTTTIRFKFASEIAAASAAAPNSLIGFIDLDTAAGSVGSLPWGEPVPGGNNWINFFQGALNVPGPTVAMDAEFYIDLFSEFFHPGLVDIISVAANTSVGTGTATFEGNLVTISFASSLIGSPGSLKYSSLVGDPFVPTDRAPNGSDPLLAEVVPAPDGAVLFGLGMASFGGGARLIRRRQVTA